MAEGNSSEVKPPSPRRTISRRGFLIVARNAGIVAAGVATGIVPARQVLDIFPVSPVSKNLSPELRMPLEEQQRLLEEKYGIRLYTFDRRRGAFGFNEVQENSQRIRETAPR